MNGVSGDGGTPTEHTAECDTLVGRLAGLLVDRTNPDVPDLHEVSADEQRDALDKVDEGTGR